MPAYNINLLVESNSPLMSANLTTMTYKVFISSRNNDNLFINGKSGISLTDIRLFLKEELEKEKFFDKDFLTVVINETFSSDTTFDSYNECLKQIDDSQLTICLYNRYSGWAPPSIDKGICHAELARAMEISSKQAAIIDISEYFQYLTTDQAQISRDELFKTFIEINNRFRNPLKIAKADLNENSFKQTLLERIKELILKSFEKRIEASNASFKQSGNSHMVLEWKTMNFDSRNKEITSLLSKMVSLDYKDIVTLVSSVPENMSTPEALKYTGRSFLNDQETISEKKNKKFRKGPIHFVGVFGNVTETQIKNLIGNPDIAILKDDFGIYVWEPALNIQMVFLTKCSTPEATTTGYQLFQNWIEFSDLTDAIKKRAEARYLISHAFVKAKRIIS